MKISDETKFNITTYTLRKAIEFAEKHGDANISLSYATDGVGNYFSVSRTACYAGEDKVDITNHDAW